MKKKGWIIVLVFIAGVVLFINTPERRTKFCFYSHLSELEESIYRWQTEGKLSSDPKLIANVWDGEHEIVEYIVVSRGIVPSSSYYGFFYSPDGVPVSFQNSGAELTRQGENEWVWQGQGDNHGYVELLQPHWYYFEASL